MENKSGNEGQLLSDSDVDRLLIAVPPAQFTLLNPPEPWQLNDAFVRSKPTPDGKYVCVACVNDSLAARELDSFVVRVALEKVESLRTDVFADPRYTADDPQDPRYVNPAREKNFFKTIKLEDGPFPPRLRSFETLTWTEADNALQPTPDQPFSGNRRIFFKVGFVKAPNGVSSISKTGDAKTSGNYKDTCTEFRLRFDVVNAAGSVVESLTTEPFIVLPHRKYLPFAVRDQKNRPAVSRRTVVKPDVLSPPTSSEYSSPSMPSPPSASPQPLSPECHINSQGADAQPNFMMHGFQEQQQTVELPPGYCPAPPIYGFRPPWPQPQPPQPHWNPFQHHPPQQPHQQPHHQPHHQPHQQSHQSPLQSGFAMQSLPLHHSGPPATPDGLLPISPHPFMPAVPAVDLDQSPQLYYHPDMHPNPMLPPHGHLAAPLFQFASTHEKLVSRSALHGTKRIAQSEIEFSTDEEWLLELSDGTPPQAITLPANATLSDVRRLKNFGHFVRFKHPSTGEPLQMSAEQYAKVKDFVGPSRHILADVDLKYLWDVRKEEDVDVVYTNLLLFSSHVGVVNAFQIRQDLRKFCSSVAPGGSEKFTKEKFELLLRFFGANYMRCLARVHEVYSLPYFHGLLSTEKAHDLLRATGPGSYLFRYSNRYLDKGYFALTCQTQNNEVCSYVLRIDEKDQWRTVPQGHTFSNVHQAVTGIDGLQLCRPVPRPTDQDVPGAVGYVGFSSAMQQVEEGILTLSVSPLFGDLLQVGADGLSSSFGFGLS
eukprot:TRINITY_DN5653_c0_g1_i1.p1 TRINITY_DN5653_c0_g1~~TRINITY_DN5653_c0_g1_i1.p1  ORF type:complete len:766 (-),score=198.75 TRINITY_DN5653_c0_g1_i1:148-2445(-)